MMYFSVGLTTNRAFGMTGTLTRGNGAIASGNTNGDPNIGPPLVRVVMQVSKGFFEALLGQSQHMHT